MSQLWSSNDNTPYEELDQFALLACQNYNIGNETDWFGSFRGGLYGFYSRNRGVQIHNDALHNWFPPRIHDPADTDYNFSSLLFNMDSAIECLTFALNALGFAALPGGFNDVGVRKRLGNISPYNILGGMKRPALSGYATIFPNVQELWCQEEKLLLQIFELHDVSKHRTTIYQGGQISDEVPTGFFETLGVDPQKSGTWLFRPHKEIILPSEPKIPRVQRTPSGHETRNTLEDLIPRYSEFLRETGIRALEDSQANIPLPYLEFQKPEA